MAANRLAPGAEAAKAEAEAAPAAGGDAAAGGGFKAWLPLLVTIVAMPALAYVTTTFVLLPKVRQALGAPAAEAAETGGGHGEEGGHGGGKAQAGKAKSTFALTKIIVNVAGTMGTRYLMTSLTLAGSAPNFQSVMEEHRDQLLDLANGTLSTKTISDLEQPGARNQIRTELLTVFNNALGGNVVQELYITEMAIQ